MAGAKLGPLVPGDKIKLKDFIKNPVWVSTYEEDEADEDAMRAVISKDPNASADVIRKFLVPMLTFKVQGTNVYGVGSYDRETDTLDDLQFWTGKAREVRRQAPRQVSDHARTALPHPRQARRSVHSKKAGQWGSGACFWIGTEEVSEREISPFS